MIPNEILPRLESSCNVFNVVASRKKRIDKIKSINEDKEKNKISNKFSISRDNQ